MVCLPDKKTVKVNIVYLHFKYNVIVVSANKTLKERTGLSRASILKYIYANYKVCIEDQHSSKIIPTLCI